MKVHLLLKDDFGRDMLSSVHEVPVGTMTIRIPESPEPLTGDPNPREKVYRYVGVVEIGKQGTEGYEERRIYKEVENVVEEESL